MRTTARIMACTGMATLLLGTAVPSAAQDANADVLKALDEAIPGTFIHDPLAMDWATGGKGVKAKVVAADALMTGEAIQVKTKKKQANGWDATLTATVTEPISEGDRIAVLYYVRTATPPKGEEAADLAMFLGRNVEPYDTVVWNEFRPSTEWEMKQVVGTAKADFPADEIKMEYHLGRAAQTVEFGPIFISRLD